MNTKKSFLLYFDQYENLTHLTSEQRGELFLLLFEYARAAADEETTDREVLLANYPNLTPETRMAFYFIAEAIRRDTESWHEKHRRYREAALRRVEDAKISDADRLMGEYMRQLRREHQKKEMP